MSSCKEHSLLVLAARLNITKADAAPEPRADAEAAPDPRANADAAPNPLARAEPRANPEVLKIMITSIPRDQLNMSNSHCN